MSTCPWCRLARVQRLGSPQQAVSEAACRHGASLQARHCPHLRSLRLWRSSASWMARVSSTTCSTFLPAPGTGPSACQASVHQPATAAGAPLPYAGLGGGVGHGLHALDAVQVCAGLLRAQQPLECIPAAAGPGQQRAAQTWRSASFFSSSLASPVASPYRGTWTAWSIEAGPAAGSPLTAGVPAHRPSRASPGPHVCSG